MSVLSRVALYQHLRAAAIAFEADFVSVAQCCAVLFAAHRAPDSGHIKVGCGSQHKGAIHIGKVRSKIYEVRFLGFTNYDL